MPLVFVHGVANRRGETREEQDLYDNRIAFIEQQFTKVAFVSQVPSGLRCLSPYWGDLGAKFAFDLKCIPHDKDVESLRVPSTSQAGVVRATAANLDPELLKVDGIQEAPVLTTARTRSLESAVDLLFGAAVNSPGVGPLADSKNLRLKFAPEAGGFAAVVQQYAEANPKPDWLASVKNDDEFIVRLVQEAETARPEVEAAATALAAAPVQSLGWGSDLVTWLRSAASRVRGAVADLVQDTREAVQKAVIGESREAFIHYMHALRPLASLYAGRFTGDVFAYMENREPIQAKVLEAIDAAAKLKQEAIKAKTGDDRLILVGHSFGGIILFDVVSQFRPDLEVDLLVTVGSQVALFAEMDRLANKDGLSTARAAGTTIQKPKNVRHWINIYDATDIVSFGTKDVFQGAHDFVFDTGAWPVISHGAYFDTPRFYQRLKVRYEEVLRAPA